MCLVSSWIVIMTMLIQLSFGESTPDPLIRTEVAPPEAKCPEDSQLLPNGVCECLSCSTVHCGEGERAVIVGESLNRPGQCCPIYDCQTASQNRSCETKDNIIYANKASWTSNCLHCNCNNGLILCSEIENCHNSTNLMIHPKTCLTENGVVYKHNEKWSKDQCTNCTCVDGEIKCMAHFCEIDQTVVANCKPLLNCHLQCLYGFGQNSKGCDVCECGLSPQAMEILKSTNMTIDDLYKILHLIKEKNITDPIINSVPNCDQTRTIYVLASSVFLLVLLIILLLNCCYYYRKHKLHITKMEVCKPDLHLYEHVSNYDSSATYKYHNETIK